MFKTQHLYQNENKWKNVTLGDSSETIGSWGGLLTCYTMMLNGIGYNETPLTVNEKLKKAGGFLNKVLPGPTNVALYWPHCEYWGTDPCKKSLVPIAEIDAAVAAEQPVILQVRAGKHTGMHTHFVLVKEKKGDDYVLYDPYKDSRDRPEKEVLLTRRYQDHGARLESEITAVLWFRRYSPERPALRSVKFPVPGDKFKLFVYDAEIFLYDQKKDSSFRWKRLRKWTDLISLEPKSIAKDSLEKAGNGEPDQWILVQDPDGVQGYVPARSVRSDLPAVVSPMWDVKPSRKKWCLKNVAIENPQFQARGSQNNDLPKYQPPKSFYKLPKNTVVGELQPETIIPGWTGILYEKAHYERSEKDWVTVRVTGRVRETDLDDYFEVESEELRTPVVTIERQTEDPTDAEQYFYILDKDQKKRARYNMCGELCVAAIVGTKIDAVLSKWQNDEKYKALYNSMVGNADRPLESGHVQKLLDLHGVPYDRYKYIDDKTTRKDYVKLADPEGDRRLASEDLEKWLKDYYFITNLRINTKTGDLEPAYAAEERNHWVVLVGVTRNRTRVELYNPYPNRIEEYTFGEFYRAIGGDPNSGWWIKKDDYPALARHAMREAGVADTTRGIRGAMATSRGTPHSLLPFEKLVQSPAFKVAIDNQTVNPEDAEQYLSIRGEGNQAKTKLCGEFCVTFLLGQSLDTALKHWLAQQNKLRKQGKQPPLWELATLLQAYGFNRRKYIRPQKDPEKGKYYVTPNARLEVPSGQSFKSFSIDSVLEYWKGVQPDLYNSLLGGNRNEPTGPEDLITILKAYGYTKEDYSYYRPGTKEVFGYAPGRDAQVIGKTHYLLAGVNIHGSTGRLQPSGVAHWVVVTKITPRGNMVGGNGGWVELYNPFPNSWEEYSYREFMNAFRGMSEGTTLWIKKDVSPDFSPQVLAAAKSREKDLKGRGKGKGKKEGQSKQTAKERKEEKDRERDEAKGKKGAGATEFDNEPPLNTSELACRRLGVDAIPWEVGKWILDTSGGDRFFAEQLTDALLECGILSIQDVEIDKKKVCAAVLTDLISSGGLEGAIKKSIATIGSSADDPVYRIAGAVLPLFLPQVVDEIREYQKKKPFHAYQPWREFRAWTRGLAAQASDPLDSMIRQRLELLPVSMKDRPDVFRVSKVVLTRFTSGAVEKEIENIWKDAALRDQIIQSWDLNDGDELSSDRVPNPVREWILTLAGEPRKNLYRVKRWGGEGMKDLDFDISVLHAKEENSNFQAIGLYNEATGFGAVANYLVIPPDDVRRLEALQIEDQYEKKNEDWLRQKMTWLCQYRGSQYMFADEDNYRGEWGWRRPDGIRWGPIALGGNLVEVVGSDWLQEKLPSKTEVANVKMAKLRGFKHTDWNRPLDELLADGLVHRCYCVYKGNDIGDSPQGITYSPFWSPEEWQFKPEQRGVPAPSAFWIPFAYLENESVEETILPLGEKP